MTNEVNDDKLVKILKDIYKTNAPSPEFKERMRRRLNEEAGTNRSPEHGGFWRRPTLWAPAAATMAAALLLVIVLVIVPALSPGTFGTLEVRVTDAKNEPVVTAIEVTFDNVSVHRAGVEGESEGEWVTVAANLGKTVDLLQLSGIGELLGHDEIESGHYTQIRVGVVRVRVTMGGDTMDVGLEPLGEADNPSGGLRFVRGFDVEADQTTVIIIDFDLSSDKSLVFAGGKWILKPTIKLNIAPA